MTGYMVPLDPTPPGPRRRVKRTVVQVALATLGAVPAAWGALQAAGVDVDPAVTALVVGIPSALVVLVSAAQNEWDAHRGKG